MQGAGRINERESGGVKVDAKDRKILFMLAQNARMPLSEIAKKVMLSRDSVAYRIRRLQEKGVILRFFPLIDYKQFGFNVYHVFIILDEHDKEEYMRLIETLEHHPNVLSMMEYNDRWDIQVSLIAKDIREFDAIMTEITSKFPNAIVEKDILENINNYKLKFLPYTIAHEKKSKQVNKEFYKPDNKDLKIMNILADNARLSTYEIGKIVGIDADTVSYRMRKMQKSGLIKKYTTLVNFSKLNYHWYTCAMQMKTFDHKHERKFQQLIKKVPNIIRAVKTLGVWDILLYIVVNDTKEFHKIVKDLRSELYDIVKAYDAWIAYEEHVYNPMPAVLLSQ